MEDDVILGIEKPLSLGGAWHPANFNEESIFEYYESTASIYARAFARLQNERET